MLRYVSRTVPSRVINLTPKETVCMHAEMKGQRMFYVTVRHTNNVDDGWILETMHIKSRRGRGLLQC